MTDSSNSFSHQTEPGYEPLAEMMQKALDQAQYGKGKERHANDRPFLKQSLMNHTRAVGTGYPCGQAMKKAEELHGMVQRGDYKNAIEECKGAAVYLLAAALYIEEFENHERVYKKGEVEQIEVKEERALVNFHCFCCGFDVTPGTIIYSDRPDDYICPNCRNYVSGMTRES